MKALTTGTILLAIAAAGCSRSEDKPAPATAPKVQNAVIATVTKSSIDDFYEATGTVKAKTTTNVSSNMMGRIVSFPVAEGDSVVRGQTLVEIDNRESQAQLQRAQAALREAQAALVEIDKSAVAARAAVKTAEENKAIAEKTFARIRELYDRRSASAQEFDEAQSRVRIAQSEVDRARANVDAVLSKRRQIDARIDQARAEISGTKVFESYSKIVSPVSGVVVKKFAESGATAAPGAPLLSIEDNSVYRLEAAVEESRSSLVRLGNRVQVRIDALGGEVFGVVSEILPAADAASRSYTVKIDLPQNPLLKSGLYGLARFPVSQKEALTVPQSALVERGQLTGVYIVAPDGTAQFRIVTVGTRSGGNAEILSGLAEGDEYVSADAAALSDGTKVR